MTLMATAELKSLVIPVATESVSKFRERPHESGHCAKFLTHQQGLVIAVISLGPNPYYIRKEQHDRDCNSNKERTHLR